MTNQPPSNAREIPLFEAIANDYRLAADPCILWLLDNRPGVRGIAADALLRYHITGEEPKISERPTDIQDFWRVWNLCNYVPGVFKSLLKLGCEVQAFGWFEWAENYDLHEAYILQHPEKFPKP